MQKLAEICVKRPVFATVLILILVVFGVFAYQRLGVDRFPNIDFPVITVTTIMPGANPEEVELEVTDKVEEAVNTVSGIEDLASISAESISQVFVSFELEKDSDIAAQEVRDRVNRILRELPDDVEQPTVEKLDPDAAPVLGIAVSGPYPLKEITEYADKVLRRRFESVTGVGQVMLVGGEPRQINITLDPVRLKSYNLTIANVARALQTQNVQVPGGVVKQGAKDFSIRTFGRVTNLDDMRMIPVHNVGGHTITLGEIATVADASAEPDSVAELNDETAVVLNIRKQSGTNTVEVVKNVKDRLADVMETLPEGYNVEVVRDQSRFIEAAVSSVQEHLIVGSILAALVVLLFLANSRTTVIAALAIPTSIISTFALMHFMGFTLNVITLLALTLSVGIVIDDAIVVLENIFRFIEEKNYEPREAAIAATREIGLAVLAITVSLIAVFLPVAFMGGIVGRFMSSFGFTMSFAIGVSLLVSFTLTPMLSARWLKKPFVPDEESVNAVTEPEHSLNDVAREHEHARSRRRGVYHWIESGYLVLLKFSMRHRWIVVLACLAALGSIPVLIKYVPKNFLPDDDQSEFQVNIQAPEGTSLESTQAIVGRIARDLRRLNGVRYTVASVADTEQRLANTGSIYTRLVESNEREFGQFDLMDFARKQILPKYQDENVRVSITPVPAFSGGGNANAYIQYLVSGPDMKQLSKYAEEIQQRLTAIPGAVDVDSSLKFGNPEYGVFVDRQRAADLGVSVVDVASTLRLVVEGDEVSKFNEGGEQYDVHLRAEYGARNSLDVLKDITVPSTKLGSVPLSDVVRFSEGIGPTQINRLNRKRQVTITANLAPGASQKAIIDELEKQVRAMRLAPGYEARTVGMSEELAKAFQNFLLAFVMAFIFVYLVIAAQFESWIHPVTILMALPLTLPFALVSLLIFGESLNVFSLLGVMVLFAVVKKNSILQVDHTNQLRAQGMPRDEAILAANMDRLRPILMTTISFVAGMFPLLISTDAGAGTNKTISSVVIGGQTLSLLLTLVATPVIYSLFDDLKNARIWGWLRSVIFFVPRLGRRAAAGILSNIHPS